MTRRCALHDAPFKNDTARWCKGSNPGDTCDSVEVIDDPFPHYPRMLPLAALLMLSSRVNHPGWLEFLITAQRMGFGIDQPGDHDLSEEDWREMSLRRVSILVASFDRMMGVSHD